MIKQLTLVLSFALATLVANAQTLVTYNMEGDGCGQYGCLITPSMDVMAPWGSTTVVGGGTPSAKYTVMTGLAVNVSGYRSFAAIPEHLSATGMGTFDWHDGAGNGPDNSGSFTTTLACTWDLDPPPLNTPTNNVFTLTCTSPVDSQGQSVTFTRHYHASGGRFGFWSINREVIGQVGLVDSSTLTILHP